VLHQILFLSCNTEYNDIIINVQMLSLVLLHLCQEIINSASGV